MALLLNVGRLALYGAGVLLGVRVYSASANAFQLATLMFAAYGAAKYFKVVR